MLNQSIIPELHHESSQTRKMLEKLPTDQKDWRPHEKSMKLGRLSSHVAEIPAYITLIITTDELDFSKGDHKPANINSKEELLEFHDKNVMAAMSTLQNASDDVLKGNWTLRNGEHVIFTLPRIAAIRTMAMNHMVHHRGQLSVYLRLLNIPVPGMYGPSADDSF